MLRRTVLTLRKSTPDVLIVKGIVPLLITATGHGRRQMCLPDKFGFPGKPKERHRTFLGYRTGDIVRATTPKGTIEGRIAIRHRPSFRIGKIDIHPKYLQRTHKADGYSYEKGIPVAPPHS